MMNMYIFGASGFSREVADICMEIGYDNITFIDNALKEETYFGYDVISEHELSEMNFKDSHFAIGIGEPAIRKKIHEKFPDFMYPNIIHPSASFGYDMKENICCSKGNIITAGVRMTNNIKLGNFGIYNLNVTVGHDCITENYITISPGANVSGNIKLENEVYVGTGSTILQGNSIDKKLIVGEGSTVGAGAVVVRDVIPNTVVKGIPAK